MTNARPASLHDGTNIAIFQNIATTKRVVQQRNPQVRDAMRWLSQLSRASTQEQSVYLFYPKTI
jgi:hypothetical protein